MTKTITLPDGVELSALAIPVADGRHMDEILVQLVRQREGPPLWKVAFRGSVLSTTGAWEYEPSPSNRDDAFLARCRFPDVDAALAAALAVTPAVGRAQ